MARDDTARDSDTERSLPDERSRLGPARATANAPASSETVPRDATAPAGDSRPSEIDGERGSVGASDAAVAEVRHGE